ncbi:MAG: YggT family protein [Streptococcus sp.]|nr:YggT family protein [Streptococcus sp.]
MTFFITVLLRVLQVYTDILIVFALLSWFPGAYESKIGKLIIWLVKPILKPFGRFRISILGVDFTIVALILVMDMISRFLGQFIF